MPRKKIVTLEELCTMTNGQVKYDKHNASRIEKYILDHSENVDPVYKDGGKRAIGYYVKGTKGVVLNLPPRGPEGRLKRSREIIYNSLLFSIQKNHEEYRIYTATHIAKSFGLFKKSIYDFSGFEYSKKELEKLNSHEYDEVIELVQSTISTLRGSLFTDIWRMEQGESIRAVLIYDPGTFHLRTFKDYFRWSGDTIEFLNDYREEQLKIPKEDLYKYDVLKKGIGNTAPFIKSAQNEIDKYVNHMYNLISRNEKEKDKFRKYMIKECVNLASEHSEEEINTLQFNLGYQITPTKKIKREKVSDIQAAMKMLNEHTISKIWKVFDKKLPSSDREKMEYIIEHCIRL